MTYVPANLLLARQAIGGAAKKFYYSSTDPKETVDTAGYFSDGQTRGMAVGDLVEVYDTSAAETVSSMVSSVSTANKSVDIQDTSVIGSTGDSD